MLSATIRRHATRQGKSMLKLLGALGVLSASFILLSYFRPPTAPPSSQPLVYGGQYYPEEFLLQCDPFWDDKSAKYKLFSSGTEGNEALIAGRVDVNVASDTKCVSLFSAISNDAVIIGCVQSGERYTTIVAPNNYASGWEDLKGKKLATRYGTGAEVVLRRFYAAKGYRWEDFNYVNLAVEDMVSALRAGHIDGFTAWSITPELAEATGAGKRLGVSYAEFSAPACLLTTRKVIEKKRSQLVDLLLVHLKKAKAIRKDPAVAARAASERAHTKGVNIPESAFLESFRRIDFELRMDAKVLDDIRATAKFMMEHKMIDRIPVLAHDARLLEDAQKLLVP